MASVALVLARALQDRYRIERELGGGGMSRVFVAEELALGRKVVIKVLPPDLGAGLNEDRFQREIHLAASLQHPHIVPLLAAGLAEGLLYYTMPLIEGESLRTKLSREGELPVPEAVWLLRDVADALSYAHEHGVLHRDVKPDNILVSRQHALVTDFGVAKALSAAAGDGSDTAAGVALGTPAYMAPEQAAADPHTDHRADLYALGVVGYEILTGNTPFPGLTGQAALAAHAARDPGSVSDLRPSIPPALAALVMGCLEKHPADRPQSASDVLQRLDGIATPSGGTAPTVPVMRPPVRSRRRLLVAVLAAAVAVIAAAIMVRRPATRELDANLIAIAPFDVLGSGLDLWREGLVDLLSRNLDGAGPLRTVSPTVVVRRWKGKADPASAVDLGRITGAGLVAFGSLIGAGRDSVRLDASIFDVSRQRSLAEVDLRGSADRMDQLADSLTVALLRQLGRSRDLVAVRTASLKATSLPALKAFLEGERLYRNGRWDSAQAAYRLALSHDSLFVPALRHLGLSLSWRVSGDNEFVPFLLRAGELNHGLPRRDSILVAGDSLMAAITPYRLPLATQRRLTERLFRTLSDAIQLYPEDPEAWYALGEASYHVGWPRVVREAEILAPFARAIALDSSFTPAYVHATDLGLYLEGLPGWRRYAKPYLRLRPTDDFATGTRLLDAMLESRSSEETDSLLESARLDELIQAAFAVWTYPDSAETGVRIAEALMSMHPQTSGFFENPALRQAVLANMLAYRGHFRRAEPLVDEKSGLTASMPGEFALVRGENSESLSDRFHTLLRGHALWPAGEIPVGGPPGQLFYVLRWWADQKDTMSMLAYVRRVDSAQRSASTPQLRETTQYIIGAAAAYRALSRGDSAAALRQFQALPHDVIWGALDRVTEGELLFAVGRDEAGIGVLEHAFFPNWKSPVRALIQLYIGRAAERVGDRRRAIDAYQRLAATWHDADPELQHYVDEARRGLARLTAERSR